MPDKRKAPSSTSSDSPYTKKARSASDYPIEGDEESSHPAPITPTTARPQPKNDPIYGQKHAFPGLDEPIDENELFYGPAEDGIEYLRMVRSEARTLPAIFISKRKTTTSPNKGENPSESSATVVATQVEATATTTTATPSGIYSDGVYIAPSHPQATAAAAALDTPDEPDPQEIYYNLLHHRFLLLRSTLKCTPPASIISSLGRDRPISLPRQNKRARAEWERIIQNMDPRMAQLACMDMESVLGLLAIVARLLSKTVKGGDKVKVKRLGAWAWGLLGRCREVGEMGSEEVGDVREVGKRAARILVKVREGEEEMKGGMENGDEVEEEGGDEGEGQGYDDGEDGDGDGVDGTNGENATGTIPESDLGDQQTELGAIPQKEANAETMTGDAQDELEAAKARLQARLQAQQPSSDRAEAGEGEIEPDDNHGHDDEGEEGEEGEVDDKDEDESYNDSVWGYPDVQQYTRAMLDMIISIIGEFYGQRDLLEFRDIWEEDMDVSW
ncbi:hypothetical protein AJ79_02610 [Helicocarpus griseus UAMH5409]|uniref:Uncharacterized protein n=1 Tax=Helicocarpus griseus UAMH5409 TaxID=1447875 RepID=A0A2B7XTJ2_9EURO|nr:hypothetical protein AJ79_02610 [Helicocarpus griseus UAMH5409]